MSEEDELFGTGLSSQPGLSSSSDTTSTEDILPDDADDDHVQTRLLPNWLMKMLEERSETDWLEDLRKLYPRLEGGDLEDVEGALSEMDEATQDYLLANDDECRKLSDFVERSADFIRCRHNTLAGPERRYDKDKTKNKYYVEFKKYLKDAGFMDKMGEVLYKMFSLHPTLPEDPITYLRDNYGVEREEETLLERRLLDLTAEVESLAAENKKLKERLLAARLADPLHLQAEPDKFSSQFSRMSRRLTTTKRLSTRGSRSKSRLKEAKEDADLTGIVWSRGEVRTKPSVEPPAEVTEDFTSSESDYTLSSLGSIP